MKFENKGKWVKQINESAQKDLANHLLQVLSKGGATLRQLQDFESKGYSNKDLSDTLKDLIQQKKIKTSFDGGTTRYILVESQKNEADAKSVVAGMTRDQAKKLYDTINNWGLGSFDIKDRVALLKEIDNKFHFSKQKNESSSNLQIMLDFSLSEENDAVANYEKRAAKCLEHGNTKLADLFKELARDEKVHVAQLTKAKELLGLVDNEIEQEGSDEAKEILVDSSQKNEASTFAKDKGLYEKKTKQNAIRYIYNKINTKGIFRDTDWSGLRKVTDQIRNLGVDLTIAPTNDSWHKSGYAVNDKNIPTEKRYDIEISFKNIDNKEIVIKGQIACQGAGSVEDPLDAYDIVMTLY